MARGGRTVSEEVEGGGHARLEAVLEEVFGGLAGVAIHSQEAHLPVVLRQVLRATHKQVLQSTSPTGQ